ncbi:hypothetical protein ABVK25_012488 [Lepraria finkii]|uniref:DUF7923 domain-containing protein n=1 Tax=Lepraria finkii TaxID=1340010 RepID=A0ABR4AF58_9LECA
MHRDEYITHLHQENVDLRKAFKLRVGTEQLPEYPNSNPRAETAELRFLEAHKAMKTKPFIYVLVDGEGYYIHEDLRQNGNRGGLELANHLKEEILNLLQLNADSRDWDIMVSFYIDVGTLFAKCVSADIKISEDCLREFACGFTQAQPSFSLGDGGHGREQAILKIQGLFQFYVENVHCKHIIFVCCHDSTCAAVLEPYMDNPVAVSQVTLLRSPRSDEYYNALTFEIAEFVTVLRPAFFTERNISVNTPECRIDKGNRSSQHQNMATPGKISRQNTIDMQAVHNWQAAANEKVDVRGLATLRLPVRRIQVPRSAQQLTWGPNDKAVLLNVNDQPVDAYLGEPDDEVYESMLDRMEEREFCTWHHINGSCYNKTCKFRYEELSKEELVVLRIHIRGRKPCEAGSSCGRAGCHR